MKLEPHRVIGLEAVCHIAIVAGKCPLECIRKARGGIIESAPQFG